MKKSPSGGIRIKINTDLKPVLCICCTAPVEFFTDLIQTEYSQRVKSHAPAEDSSPPETKTPCLTNRGFYLSATGTIYHVIPPVFPAGHTA